MSLFEKMQKEVDRYVKSYQTDFTIHDKAYLEKYAKKGTIFYWLVREHGTQLEREGDLYVDSERWNKLVFLDHYVGTNSKLFRITITDTTGDIEGKLEQLPFPQALEQFKEKRTPKLYELIYKGKSFFREWDNPTVEEMEEFLSKQLKEEVDFRNVVMNFTF